MLARFTLCLTSYLQFIGSLLYIEHPHTKPVVAVRCGSNVSCHDHDGDPPRRRGHLARPVKWDLLEALSTNLSQFSLVILSTDESGGWLCTVVFSLFSFPLCMMIFLQKIRGEGGGFMKHLQNFDAFMQVLSRKSS